MRRISAIQMTRLGLVLISIFSGWLSFRDYQQAQVTVEWSTASELSTIGFNIYRGSQPDAPEIRINRELIASSSDPLIGGEYSFADGDVQPGLVYFYWLEDVEDSGKKTLHGPIEVKAQGKIGYKALAFGLSTGLLFLSFFYSPAKNIQIQGG